MLFIHETHQVIGDKEDEFEAAFREGWMPALAKGDDARLLWYMNHAHGSGPAYHVVTITGFRDGAAWEDMAHRVAEGDLREQMADMDRLRHDVNGKVLINVPWSPLRDLDLSTVPTDGATHPLSLYMEDTGWPHAPIDDYIRYWGEDYYPMLESAPPKYRLLEVQACFRPAHGAGLRREGILLQKIHSYDRLLGLLTTEVPAEQKAPGTYMREALKYRDRWQSRLLRTSAWSPMY